MSSAQVQAGGSTSAARPSACSLCQHAMQQPRLRTQGPGRLKTTWIWVVLSLLANASTAGADLQEQFECIGVCNAGGMFSPTLWGSMANAKIATRICNTIPANSGTGMALMNGNIHLGMKTIMVSIMGRLP